MTPFKKYMQEELIIEAIAATDDDTSTGASRKSMLSLITSYFQRFTTGTDADTKPMLYLIAALNVLNSSEDDAYAVSTAKRLAQMAFVKSGRMKKGS